MSRLVNFRFGPVEDAMLTALAAREGLTKTATVRLLVLNAATSAEKLRKEPAPH